MGKYREARYIYRIIQGGQEYKNILGGKKYRKIQEAKNTGISREAKHIETIGTFRKAKNIGT